MAELLFPHQTSEIVAVTCQRRRCFGSGFDVRTARFYIAGAGTKTDREQSSVGQLKKSVDAKITAKHQALDQPQDTSGASRYEHE